MICKHCRRLSIMVNLRYSGFKTNLAILFSKSRHWQMRLGPTYTLSRQFASRSHGLRHKGRVKQSGDFNRLEQPAYLSAFLRAEKVRNDFLRYTQPSFLTFNILQRVLLAAVEAVRGVEGPVRLHQLVLRDAGAALQRVDVLRVVAEQETYNTGLCYRQTEDRLIQTGVQTIEEIIQWVFKILLNGKERVNEDCMCKNKGEIRQRVYNNQCEIT